MKIYLIERSRSISRRKRILKFIYLLYAKQRLLINKALAIMDLSMNYIEIADYAQKLCARKERVCRRFVRNTGWWEVTREGTDSDFKKKFRIGRNTFYYILEQIRERIVKEEVTETPICPEMRLGICLYKLARGDYNFTVGEMAGVAESTVCVITIEVCTAIVKLMWTEQVGDLFPESKDQFISSMKDMEAHWQFGFSFSAVDGSHIPIRCPSGGALAMKQYYNFKNFYSVVLLALVDANYRFIWASCGAPGNTHDSTYLQSTDIWTNICNGTILPDDIRTVDGTYISPVILGDGAFPMKTFLMKPYGDAILSEDKRYFNYRLSRARMVSEGAFGKLKSRFRVLHKECESQKETVKIMTLACVVLHNLSIVMKDILPRKFDLTVDPITQEMRSREDIRDILDMSNLSSRPIDAPSLSAKEIRDQFKDIFWSERNPDN